MRSFATLLKNELKLNIRNMNMVIFAVILPLVVLVILGFLYGTSPAAEGAGFTFLEQSIGALCTISICAGGLMGLPLVVSEYRERKILKRFKVTPISPIMLLLVEFLIYVIYSAVSLATVIPVAMLFWKVEMHGSWIAFLGSWLLTMVSTLSIGMMVGGVAKNAKTASVIACMNIADELSDDARLQFEHEVLRSFGIDEYFEKIKNSLLSMQASRAAVKG